MTGLRQITHALTAAFLCFPAIAYATPYGDCVRAAASRAGVSIAAVRQRETVVWDDGTLMTHVRIDGIHYACRISPAGSPEVVRLGAEPARQATAAQQEACFTAYAAEAGLMPGDRAHRWSAVWADGSAWVKMGSLADCNAAPGGADAAIRRTTR